MFQRRKYEQLLNTWRASADIFSASNTIGAALQKQLSVTDEKVTLELFIDLDEVPFARAREYGSGIHAPPISELPRSPNANSDGTIRIVPKSKQYLAFHWPKAHEKIPRLPDGRVLLESVRHPGQRGFHYMEESAEHTFSEENVDRAVFEDIDMSILEALEALDDT